MISSRITDADRIELALSKAEKEDENICRNFVAILAGTLHDKHPELHGRLMDLARKDVDLTLAEKYK